MTRSLEFRDGVLRAYPDVYTHPAIDALEALAPFNRDRRNLMMERTARRLSRFHDRQRINFLHADSIIPRTSIRVADARAGNFDGSEIPADLERQWIQGTGPAARPTCPTRTTASWTASSRT